MSDSTSLKGAVYEQVARIGKAVCSPQRLEILAILSQSPRHVESLAQETHLALANASRHLQVLKAARLVETERRGNQVLYRLAGASVDNFLRAYIGMAETRLAEIQNIVERFHEGKQDLQPVDRIALIKAVRKGEVLVLDVRPKEEYEAGHIRGAVSMPLKELEKRLAELPKSQSVAAYCRGPYCMFAVKAAEVLRRKGFDAVVLKESVQDWKAMGYQIEAGPGKARAAQGKGS
ncbi:MAG TPA: metalloregulator ArsR/SmtB family transcription factor [Fibrobacteria bacterium]|nr:metalloregulator ArsR/SmtB family transcription factor [Fibrobacteria bacterium]